MSYRHIRTLKGLTQNEIIELSKHDTKYYFKVKLYDKSKMCAGCKKPIKLLEQASIDHIIPRDIGGCTRESNLQLMHRRCNGAKSNKLPYFSTDMMRAFTPMTKNTPRGKT